MKKPGFGLWCGVCGGKTSVADSRASRGSIWRRRRCLKCAAITTTYEITRADMRVLRAFRLGLEKWEQSQ